jgi:3-oxoacyl-(acyl-carrier-protein) synthase/acyl carrier protein
MAPLKQEGLERVVDLPTAKLYAGGPTDEVWSAVDTWLGGIGGNLKLFGLMGKEGMQQMIQQVRIYDDWNERVLSPTEIEQICLIYRSARYINKMTDSDPMPSDSYALDIPSELQWSAGALAKRSKHHAWTGPAPEEIEKKPRRRGPRKPPPEARTAAQLQEAMEDAMGGTLCVKGYSYIHGPESWKATLVTGHDCGVSIPFERWDYTQYYTPNPDPRDRAAIYTRHGVFLERAEPVDWQFFGIPAKEAKVMAPMERWCIKYGYRAFVDAKLTRHQLQGSMTGVLTGTMNMDYHMDITGILDKGSQSMTACRLSHCMNLCGPAMVVDTGCSSSLVTADMAAGHVKKGRTMQSLAMGVCALISPQMYNARCAGHLLSTIGRSQAFDSDSDGYIVGEGCGGLLIGWVSEPADKQAQWRGSQTMQDGRSAQLTAPSGPAQHDLLRDTMRRARIKADEIQVSECQCNGSHMGDPIETGSLEKIHRDSDRTDDALVLCTGKTNKGHGEGLAGCTGLVKSLLLLKDHMIQPMIHLQNLNPHIDVEGLPWVLPSESGLLPTYDVTTVVGSAFGWGGVNGHFIMQAKLRPKEEQPQIMPQMMPWMFQQQGAMPMMQMPTAAPVQDASAAPPQQQEQQYQEESVAAAPESQGLDLDYVQQTIKKVAEEAMDGDVPELDAPLMDSGLDSLAAIGFRNKLQQVTGMSLKGTLMFDYPTMGEIADHIVEESQRQLK